ncbi:MAG: hypothetical protein LUE31_05925 [Lachnospiraceae bacterium]|nr:hypothetical protein [Lachnospiraceae bacterium]
MKNWESLEALFTELNESCNYLVLRNFEHLFEDGFLSEHPDIDFLCDAPRKFIEASASVPRGNSKELFSRKILVAGEEIPVDLRIPGDGYYDEPWESAMLAGRRRLENGVYVMDETEYYYSLIYHALIQKRTLSEEYRARLQAMGEKLGVSGDEPLLAQLESYMRSHGYQYSCTAGDMNLKGVDRSLIKREPAKRTARLLRRSRRRIKEKIRSWVKR